MSRPSRHIDRVPGAATGERLPHAAAILRRPFMPGEYGDHLAQGNFVPFDDLRGLEALIATVDN